MSTTTNLDKLKINYLTQEQYEDAVENEEINENELYFTPGHNNDAIVPVELTQAEYDALTTEQKNNGMVYCVSDASGTYLTASEVSYGSSSVQDALDGLEEKVKNPTSATTLLNDTIAVTGTTSWQQIDGTVSIAGYKYIRLYVYIHGTLRSSIIIPMEALMATANLEFCTIYWDANNLGSLQIRRDGHWWVDAKAKDLIFYYTIIGYK